MVQTMAACTNLVLGHCCNTACELACPCTHDCLWVYMHTDSGFHCVVGLLEEKLSLQWALCKVFNDIQNRFSTNFFLFFFQFLQKLMKNQKHVVFLSCFFLADRWRIKPAAGMFQNVFLITFLPAVQGTCLILSEAVCSTAKVRLWIMQKTILPASVSLLKSCCTRQYKKKESRFTQ